MQRIEFSEMTNRLHRNLMIAAALIICITFFGIQIGKVTAAGIELVNFTTGVLLTILIVTLIYHAIAFAIRAFEEYRLWELQLSSKQATYYGGGVGVLELADQFRNVSETLENIIENSGLITHQGQTVISQDDAAELKQAAKAAIVYGKRLKNFPLVTRVRFWGWDIGTAAAVTIVAILFACERLPSSHILFCGSP